MKLVRLPGNGLIIGTEVNIVQEGVPDIIPAEACYLWWQESLILLGKLVEAESELVD